MATQLQRVQRVFYQDKYNCLKTWEIVKMKGAFYIRQYIKGVQTGKGQRVTKAWLKQLNILNFQVLGVI